MKPSLSNYLATAALCLVFALAAIVRFECARDELWIDEYITAWTVADGLSESSERARISNQSPPYTWLILGVTHAFGMSAASLRGPSLVCGLFVVILSAWLAWQLTKLRTAAILATFLAAVDPNFVFYASEARSYAIVQLLGLIGACCVWKWYSRVASQQDAKSTAAFPLAFWSGAAIAMFYFHFTSLFAIASQAVFGWIGAQRLGTGKKQWVAATIFVGAMGIPGVVALSAMYSRAADWRALSSLTGFLHSLQFSGLMYFLPAIAGLACACVDRRVWRDADWNGILILLSIALATIAAVMVVTGLGIAPLGHYRYVIAATGLGPALGASYLAAWKRGWARGIAAVALIVAAWSQTSIGQNLDQRTMQAPMRWERWSKVIQPINAEIQVPPLPVIVFPNLIEDYRIDERDFDKNQSYFWAALAVLNRLDERIPVFARPTWTTNRFDAASLEQIRQACGAWLVIRGGSDTDSAPGHSLADSIVDELRQKLKEQGAGLRQERFGPVDSVVLLIRVRIVSPQ